MTRHCRIYSYDRRRFASSDELITLLNQFQRGVDSVEKQQEAIGVDDNYALLRTAYLIASAFKLFKQLGVGQLFLGLIQQYQMSSADRKVIERAAKAFARNSMRKPKPEQALEVFQKTTQGYRTYIETARKVLREGKTHTDEDSGTTLQAGCLTLVNAGGFNDKQMGDVQKVTENVVKKLKAKGLGRVCYGTAQVTRSIAGSKNLAFYLVGKDQLFIRGNLRGKQGFAEDTLLHELGHRLHYKFLKSKDDEIKAIYKRLSGDQKAILDAMERDKSQWPQPGETMQSGRKTYVVDKVTISTKYNYVVLMHDQKKPEAKASVALRKWFQYEKGGSFVSHYASTDYAENFAEMITHYCQGTLPDDQVRMLETVL